MQREAAQNNLESICQSRLFSGISPDDIPQMLKCLSATRKEYVKDEMVVREGDYVDDVGIILQGLAQSTKLSPAENKLLYPSIIRVDIPLF